MMVKIALFFILMTSHVALCAAETNDDWTLLKPQNCRFSGEFTQQKLLQGLDQALVSTGVFFYDCDSGIIWKTLIPTIESLVLNKTGDSYLVKRLKIETIQSARNKFISQLIMALVSADEDYLSTAFEQSKNSSNTVILTPKNRRLKRAIKTITLTQSIEGQITFDMLDQNQQTTSITSTVLNSYNENTGQDSAVDCATIATFTNAECDLLNASNDQ